MTKINQRDVMESKLDLREWLEMVKDSNEAESRVLSGEKWPFCWYDESKQWIVTLKDGLYSPIQSIWNQCDFTMRFRYSHRKDVKKNFKYFKKV